MISASAGILTTYSAIFSAIFSEAPSGGRTRKGDDLRYNLEIEFEEAVFGAEKEIEIPQEVRCSACGGSRIEPGFQPTICKACNGKGQARYTQGFFTINRTCEHCGGEGQVIKDPCKTCKGRGVVGSKRTVKINVPPGVDTGTRLKMRGEGAPGSTRYGGRRPLRRPEGARASDIRAGRRRYLRPYRSEFPGPVSGG